MCCLLCMADISQRGAFSAILNCVEGLKIHAISHPTTSLKRVQGAGLEAVNNGAMASIPGHALWLEAAQILQERKTIMNFGPVFQTGPKVMVDTIDRVAGVNLENIKACCPLPAPGSCDGRAACHDAGDETLHRCAAKSPSLQIRLHILSACRAVPSHKSACALLPAASQCLPDLLPTASMSLSGVHHAVMCLCSLGTMVLWCNCQMATPLRSSKLGPGSLHVLGMTQHADRNMSSQPQIALSDPRLSLDTTGTQRPGDCDAHRGMLTSIMSVLLLLRTGPLSPFSAMYLFCQGAMRIVFAACSSI